MQAFLQPLVQNLSRWGSPDWIVMIKRLFSPFTCRLEMRLIPDHKKSPQYSCTAKASENGRTEAKAARSNYMSTCNSKTGMIWSLPSHVAHWQKGSTSSKCQRCHSGCTQAKKYDCNNSKTTTGEIIIHCIKQFESLLSSVRLLVHRHSALIRFSQVAGNRGRNKRTDVHQPGLEKKSASSCSLVREKQYKSLEQYLWLCDTFTETFSSPKTSHNLLKHLLKMTTSAMFTFLLFFFFFFA